MGALLFELLVQLLLELAVAPAVELAAEPLARIANRSRTPVPTLLVIAVGGGGLGAIFSAVFRDRLIPPFLPGASLVLSPLAVGTAMYLFGRWRSSQGHSTTLLASFAGGAAFGLGIAAGRLVGLLYSP